MARPTTGSRAFGGPAWTRDERSGRWYLHCFYPEQPDLDWRNPEVREAMGDVVRFWRDRGVDGFRVDAVTGLPRTPTCATTPRPPQPFPLPLHRGRTPASITSTPSNGPEIGQALAAIREAAGDGLLVGEVYLPNDELVPYLEHFDLAFAFELLHAPWDAVGLRADHRVGARALGRAAWVLSNHDFPRLATRFGSSLRAAGRGAPADAAGGGVHLPGRRDRDDGRPGREPAHRPAGRDGFRHPMQWEAARQAASPPASRGFP